MERERNQQTCFSLLLFHPVYPVHPCLNPLAQNEPLLYLFLACIILLFKFRICGRLLTGGFAPNTSRRFFNFLHSPDRLRRITVLR